MNRKAIVLSSGGVDSTTCVAIAVENYGKENVSTVSIFYGQKHRKELEAARKVAKFYAVKHYEFNLKDIFKYSDCSLLAGSDRKIIHKSYAKQIEENGKGKVGTYVPFRNGLMLSICSTLAQSIYEDDECDIFIGAHADDAAGDAYADCSESFLTAMAKAIKIGTYGKVTLRAPFTDLNKAGVVRIGLKLKVPYKLTCSCYEGGDKPCGTCGTCIDRAAAFAANGVKDPALEED